MRIKIPVSLILAFLLLASSFTVAGASDIPIPVGVRVKIDRNGLATYVSSVEHFFVQTGFLVLEWSSLAADVQSAFLDPQQNNFTLHTSAPNFQNPPLTHYTDYDFETDAMSSLFFFQFHPGDLARGTYSFTGTWSATALANPPDHTPIHFQTGVTLVITTPVPVEISESDVLALVNGSEAYWYDLQLESIALSHLAFRVAGSAGATESADWIASQFESFGLEVTKEEFQFTNWDLPSKPTLVIDDDGNDLTTTDQFRIESFQCKQYSLPASVFADLVVLPLPPAQDRNELGMTPIGTLWDSINTTDKIVFVGSEVRQAPGWHEAFVNKLEAQPPVAVIDTWWYDWMASTPYMFHSSDGLPLTRFGPYYWDLGIAAGSVSYDDGLHIREKESSRNASAKVTIESTVGFGPHYNVVGNLTGRVTPEKVVIISGHYDTPMCAGFCDNGAGTAGVIELARVFSEAYRQSLYKPEYTLVFVAFAGEELCLVGSAEYIKQHQNELNNILAMINLDCIGNDMLMVAETELDHGIDLDEILIGAARDLNITVQMAMPAIGGDAAAFVDPSIMDDSLMKNWGISLGLGDAHPVKSSSTLVSSPGDLIHTWYDNSTSTGTLSWVEADDLEDQIQVAALAAMRISQPPTTDLNGDGTVNILDLAAVAAAYNTRPGDEKWNAAADFDKNGTVNILDISAVARDFGKTFDRSG